MIMKNFFRNMAALLVARVPARAPPPRAPPATGVNDTGSRTVMSGGPVTGQAAVCCTPLFQVFHGRRGVAPSDKVGRTAEGSGEAKRKRQGLPRGSTMRRWLTGNP
jgi:hypothetical protein